MFNAAGRGLGNKLAASQKMGHDPGTCLLLSTNEAHQQQDHKPVMLKTAV